METLVLELEEIYKKSNDNKSVKENMKLFMEQLETKDIDKALEYFQKREKNNEHLLILANNKVGMIKKLLEENGIQGEVILTSSLNAGTNLIGDSDIDITILVDGCTNEVTECVEKLLVEFKYCGVKNDYYLFQQKTPEVEYEVKLREKKPAMVIMQLHHILNNLSVNEKIVITYGKLLFHQTDHYNMFKILMYNMYFADVLGCYLLK